MILNKFSRDDVKSLLVLLIFVALIVVAVRFIIYLLPFIIVALLVYLVYDSVKRKKRNTADNTVKEAEVIEEKKTK